MVLSPPTVTRTDKLPDPEECDVSAVRVHADDTLTTRPSLVLSRLHDVELVTTPLSLFARLYTPTVVMELDEAIPVR